MRSKPIYIVLLVSILLALSTSCGKQAYYDNVYSFDGQRWEKSDTATFAIAVDDTTNRFKFSLSLRTTTSYPYSNMWVYILSTAPDGSTSKVAQKLPLARPDGSWIGTVSGTVVQTEVKFASKHFPLKGDYVFELVNAIQQGDLNEVLDVGLRIQK